MKYIIITGSTSGLGASVSKLITGDNVTPVLIARNKSSLELQTTELPNKNAKAILFDLSHANNSAHLIESLMACIDINIASEIILINNAGSIQPITSVSNLDSIDITKNISINITIPMILISSLLAFTVEHDIMFKVINISSGAYKTPIEGWSLYCASKSSLKMFIDVVHKEYKTNDNIKVISIDPGVMNTNMQQLIRVNESTSFSDKQNFINLHNNNLLTSPDDVARLVHDHFILTWTCNESYVKLASLI